jgi:fumarate hydratase class I
MAEAIRINLPLFEEAARRLVAGQFVLLNGLIVTGRDRIHKYLFDNRPDKGAIPFPLEGSVLYHCGPIVREMDGSYKVISAGPTTSGRMQMYEPFVIEHYKIRGVMGKGGMAGATLSAMRDLGCVYLNTIGGAGALLAQRIKRVRGVWMIEEFGRAEAMWAFEVEDFPAMVSIDTHGRSIHEEVEARSRKELETLLAR